MKYKVKSPICLIGFNRPKHIVKVIHRISEVKPDRLYIVQDGPRSNRGGEAEACAEVRSVLESGINWPCEILWKIREKNAGCRKNVSEGIAWFYEHEEEGIILEDDCIPDLSFFRYCDELLDKYRDDPNIVCVSGNCFAAQKLKNYEYSYYYSIFNHCWGWASWRRAWSHYDVEMKSYDPEHCHRYLMGDLKFSKKEADYWVNTFTAVANREVDTWDYVWTYSCWMNLGLTCLPSRNLVENIGFDELATHTRGGGNMASKAYSLTFPLNSPASFKVLGVADKYVQKNVFIRGLRTRILSRLKRCIAS